VVTALLMVLATTGAVQAQEKPPEETYGERVEEARAEYRMAMASQIRKAKYVELLLLRFDDMKENEELTFAQEIERDEEWNGKTDEKIRFPIDPYDVTTSVISKRQLKPVEVKEVLFALANQIEKPKHTGGAICHFPIHGLRVFASEPTDEPFADPPLSSGSFCWACRNFGFDYPDGAEMLDTSDELKAILNKLLPVPQAELDRFRKKYPHKSRDK